MARNTWKEVLRINAWEIYLQTTDILTTYNDFKYIHWPYLSMEQFP